MEEGENIHIIKNMYIERMVCVCVGRLIKRRIT